LRRSHPQGREAGRPARASANQVRAGDQSQDREGARARRADNRAGARRRGDRMKRRAFITLLGGTAALPISAHAQQPLKIWRIGVLESATRELNTPNMNVFLKTFREYGYIEGENLVIEYRSTGGRNERLPELVSELMRLKVNLMLVRGTPEILAVKKATSTIPVVMLAVADPVGLGVAASLSHPGGNITGMDSFTTEVETKRLGLLKELLPEMKR